MHELGKWFGGVLLVLSFIVLVAQPAMGQQAPFQSKVGDTSFSFSAFPLYQLDTGLEGGGDYSVRRYFFRLDAGRQMTTHLKAGIGFSYDYEDWDFSGASGFRGVPWGQIYRTGVSMSFLYTGVRKWALMVLPSLQSARESGSDWGDGLQTGAVLAASRAVSPKLMLGVGGGFFFGLEETSVFPFLVIRWQITEHLTLANPLRAGPTGPAGLELIYSFGKSWEVAAGSAWRSFRFRLDDQGLAPDGIGEVSFIPTWGRITWRLNRNLALALYAGVAFAGELKLEDQNGNTIGTVDQDNAWFGAFTVNFRF